MQGPVDPTEIQAGEGDEADGRPATLDRTSLLDSGADPELERWTAALRRDTGAELASVRIDRPRTDGDKERLKPGGRV